jgi:hypothetical protein
MRFGTPIPLVTPPRPEGGGWRGPGPEPPEGVSGADGATSAPARPPDLGQTVAVRLVPSADGRIRRVGDRLEWLCPACEGVNAIDELACRVCGNPILDLFRLPGPPVAARRPGVALGLSVVPGLGCWYAGSLGQGLARLLLAGTWLAVLVAAWPRPEPAMLLVKVPFLLALVGLWVASAVDARRLAGGGRPLVEQRVLAVAAAVLSLVLAVGLVVTFGSSSGRLAGRGSPGGGPSSGQVPAGGAPSSGRVPPGGPAGPGNGAR